MRLVSWNVNGLRACCEKGFYDSVKALDADVICLQEIKLKPEQFENRMDGYEVTLNSAQKPGYSGTAVFTRVKPLRTVKDMGIPEHDMEGRVILSEFDGFQLVCCYTPNSQDGLKRLDYRMDWEDCFRDYLLGLDGVKPVVVCGDLNVAHEPIDLANPEQNHMNPGFSDQEREKLTRLLGSGFTDTFRALHPDAAGAYSWWSYRTRARERGVGWRIDYFLTSQRLRENISKAYICDEILGSDYCPVGLDLTW